MNEGIRWDCHMHSSFSADSDAPMEEMISAAGRRGLKGICLTEHLDPDFPKTPDGIDFSLDIPAYMEHVRSTVNAGTAGITVLTGLEAGLQPHLGAYYTRLLSEYSFDFVIGSSHIVHGKDPYYPVLCDVRDEADCYQEYFSSIIENLNAFSDFDVYGHLDYIVRYGPSKNRYYSYSAYSDYLEPILHLLIEKGVGLEINTAGFHYGLGEPNPSTEILRRYRELGGEIITVGSDAHSPDRVAADFDRAKTVLRQCGYRYYTVFRERRPCFYAL